MPLVEAGTTDKMQRDCLKVVTHLNPDTDLLASEFLNYSSAKGCLT